MDKTTHSLLSLPYDILHLIFHQLDRLRVEASKPPRGRPKIPTNPTHYVYFRPHNEELPPQQPHDSPRRAEKYRIEQANLYRDASGVSLSDPSKVAPAPYEGVSMFDGLSRTNKALRELSAPYLFKNVVLASDDCLTLDRIEFYAGEKARWMWKHVRSLRLMCTNVTWPNSVGGNTPEHLLPDIASTLVSLLTSLRNLHTLHFTIEPLKLISELKSILIPNYPSLTSAVTFPSIKHLSINVNNEYLTPLCSPDSGGLESFDYKAAFSFKSSYKVTFSTGLFGGMVDPKAVEVVKGLETGVNPAGQEGRARLKKIVLAAFINDSGILQMAKAGILQNVTEMVLLYGVASSCATSLSQVPNLRYIRFGQDAEPCSAKNPHCYMSRRELLNVARNGKKIREVWHRGRFVCYVKRLEGEFGQDGTEVDEERTWWMDTWAPDGVGNAKVISSGWLG